MTRPEFPITPRQLHPAPKKYIFHAASVQPILT